MKTSLKCQQHACCHGNPIWFDGGDHVYPMDTEPTNICKVWVLYRKELHRYLHASVCPQRQLTFIHRTHFECHLHRLCVVVKPTTYGPSVEQGLGVKLSLVSYLVHGLDTQTKCTLVLEK